jgi:hypothetical protein
MRTSFLVASSLLVAHAAFAQCGINDGLVARYSFDTPERGIDSSGNLNHGVVAGATSFTGISGDALNFTDNSCVLTVPNSPSLNPTNQITLSAWWLASTITGTGNDPLIDKSYYCHCYPYYQYHLGVSGLLYGQSPGSIGFTVNTSTGNVGAGTPAYFYQAGNWYHLVAIYDGDAASLYVNGVLINSNPGHGTISSFNTSLGIGHFINLPYSIQGGVDEVAIYDRALSYGEIQYLYHHPDGSLGFTLQPASQALCVGNDVTFTVAVSVPAGASYRWRFNRNDLSDGNGISGATTQNLHITNGQGFHSGVYDCIVTAPCGSIASEPATLQICPANFNCDDAVDFFDYLDFVDAFSSSNLRADFNHDDSIDFFDYLDFVDAFSMGC